MKVKTLLRDFVIKLVSLTQKAAVVATSATLGTRL